MEIDLIYCAASNKYLDKIAIEAGYLYGARLPVAYVYDYAPLYFADQEWENPDREKYVSALKKHKPEMATVLDLEREDQFDEVMDWAEEVAQIVNSVIIIPKVNGIIKRLPREINGKRVILGYSVPTKFSKTEVPIEEFQGWPVHLLGGSPHAQMRLADKFNTVSIDGNYILKMATRFCQFWVPGDAKPYAVNRWFPTIKEANGGERWGGDVPGYRVAFKRSCQNVMEAWQCFMREGKPIWEKE